MGNFLQDVGRSTISSSIKDLITSKLAIDQGERADVASANANALSAEQLIQAKRANEVAAEKEKYDNTPLPVNVLADSFEGGKDGPIFQHMLKQARGMGLVDETNPNNPVILRKHANNEMAKVFERDVMQINNMRLDYLYQNKAAIQAEAAKKPGDEKLAQQLEAINQKISQATMHDADLKEAAKLAQAAKLGEAHNATSIATNAATNAVSMRNANVQAASRITAADRTEAGKAKTAGSKTAMERAHNDFVKISGNEDVSLEEFKKNNWEKDRPTGELNDNSALKLISDTLLMSGKDPAEIARVNKIFFKYKKQGMNAGDAYQKALDEYGGASTPVPVKPSGTKDMSYLWK